MRVLAARVALLVATAAAAHACTLELEPRMSCGDGFKDELAGEECDPGDPSSFENACAQTQLRWGVADCDPETCLIIDTREQCCWCGDGYVSPECGEECDGDNLDGKRCDGGTDALQCNDCKLDSSQCPVCGNGHLDPGEECDAPDMFLGIIKPCASIPAPEGYPPYTCGDTSACTLCRFDRTSCGWCEATG
jgi:hypothetical protein